jgi:carbon-monoxide dehydrogenase large subunit
MSAEPQPLQGKFFGQPVKRREDKRLLLGRGRFVADLKPQGMLEMAVVRSTHAHARLGSIDVTRARAHPRVFAVLTWADIAPLVQPMPALDLNAQSLPAFQSVLAHDKVRYVGEPIAVVIAQDRYVAEDAADLIQIQYEPLPALTEIDQALAPGAIKLYDTFEDNIVHRFSQSTGNVATAFAQADHVLQETFRIHRYTGIPTETRGVLADADAVNQSVTLWTSTQFPHSVRARLAGVLSWPESKIRVIAPDVGGGFGVKEAFYCEEVLAPLASLKLGRPIRWIEDRAEHFASAAHGREQTHTIEAAVQNDGTVQGIKATCVTNIGAAYSSLSNAPGAYVSAMLRGPYRIPHYQSDVCSVVTNKAPLNVYRGAGHPQAVFCMERMMDRIAEKLGLDRAEVRKKNMITSAEMPSDRDVTIGGFLKVVYDSGDYPACLDQALALLDYENFPAEQEQARQAGRYLGLGLSFFVETTALGPYETATIRVDAGGRVTLLTGSSPHGQGTATTHCQLVADALGVDPDVITVIHGDTGIIPDGIGTYASRGGPIGGTAAQLAALQVKAKATKLAGHLLEVSEVDLEWKQDRVQVKGAPTRGFTLGELSARASAWNRLPEGMDFNLEATHHFKVPNASYANAAQIAVVEIDIETGRLKILRYGVAHDCGRVINPMIVEGQVVGGVVQGMGGTLHEELIYGSNGQLLTTGVMDYPMPVAGEMPTIQLAHMETPSPHNPNGMKGAGEGGLTGAPAALANAIEDALRPFGVRINDDGPFTPTKILALLKEARK